MQLKSKEIFWRIVPMVAMIYNYDLSSSCCVDIVVRDLVDTIVVFVDIVVQMPI